ncbi:MAG: Fur family transcriptional regulator [Aureliella sp.]
MSIFEESQSREIIRQAGLRATPARVATLELLTQASSPLAHAEVAEHLSKTSIDKATAFRALNDMTEAGLLRRTELGDRVWRFELLGEGEEEHSAHPHFVCIECGQVTCLGDIKLTKKSLASSEQIGTITEILLRGQCTACDK